MRFEPAEENGEKLAVRMIVKYNLELRDHPSNNKGCCWF